MMRTVLLDLLIFSVLAVATSVLWWNSTRIEAWAENVKTDRQEEQERQRVRNAEVFLQKGLEELDREIARLERVRYEHRVAAEEARLRASKQRARLADAEQLAIEFSAARKKANGKPFEFLGRTYTNERAQAQFDHYAREVLARREKLNEFNYQQVSHRHAGEHLAKAIATLTEAKEKAKQEGQRLLVDRDVADARALASAVTDPDAPREADAPGTSLHTTLKALRDHLRRREAEGAVREQDRPAGVNEALRRKRELQKADELERLKDELRERAEGMRP